MILQFSDFEIEAGCDEAGRGCLAGPVVAAAVILPKNYSSSIINDSKQLSHKKRLLLKTEIENVAVEYAVSFVNPSKIDKINILNASILAMHLALNKLKSNIDFISVDGNQFKKYKNIPHTCLVKGDTRFINIAAASILAKTHRDKYMEELDSKFPNYNWKQNKGYPTKIHRKAIQDFGVTQHHRQSFKLLPNQLKLNL